MKIFLISIFLFFFVFTTNAQFGPYNEIDGEALQPTDIVVIDFDRDGDVDIVTLGMNNVFWLENLGDGNYAPPQNIARTGDGFVFDGELEVSDFDMDGDYDVLFIADYFTQIRFAENLGDCIFDLAATVFVDESFSFSFEVADMNADGNPDIINLESDFVHWLEGDGSGAIASDNMIVDSRVFKYDLLLVDIDLDSDLDLLWCLESDPHQILLVTNLGGGVFDAPIIVAEGMEATPRSVCTADIDGDGDLDVVFSVFSGAMYWAENSGPGVFEPFVLISDIGIGKVVIAPGDIDVDGDVDLITTSNNDDKVYFHKNVGGGIFETPLMLTDAVSSADMILLADYEEDGDLDIFVIGKYETIGWIENGTISPTYVEGQVYYDENENGVKDGLERGIPRNMIVSDPVGTESATLDSGYYVMNFLGLPDGDYEVVPEMPLWRITSAVDAYDVTLPGDFEFLDTFDFGMVPNVLIDSIRTDLTGSYRARCHDTIGVWLSTANLGTSFPSGIMHLELDDSLDYVSADIVPDSIVGQNLYWSFDDLYFYEVMTFQVFLGTPYGEGGDVSSVLTTSIIEDDAIVFSVSAELTQPIICAYDPNDKTPNPMGEGPEGGIPASTDWIEYTVRFQNTGTDYAEDVIIRDQLDDNLIWTSIQPLFSSHDMEFEFDPSGEVAFVFNDIMLLDSNTNELESHGFVKYRVRMKPDLAIGETIENTAYIYFDFNEAVITNTALNTIVEPKGLGIDSDGNETELIVYPNPTSGIVNIRLSGEQPDGYSVSVINLMGQEVYKQNNVNGDMLSIETNSFEAGVYIISVAYGEDQSLLHATKLIVE
ncbi:T9SS type A sorting domain-containing protein [Crocinitomix catalasitica]|uniref:T9SS type A sorting domain-containing protein n=1 Tax=Crocinitomix catalasitica TaxID=184607 RepID=UPI000483403A|nr:T9SS type A sorting domain-containing protein [Crocinitomix catalasitica]